MMQLTYHEWLYLTTQTKLSDDSKNLINLTLPLPIGDKHASWGTETSNWTREDKKEKRNVGSKTDNYNWLSGQQPNKDKKNTKFQMYK